MKTNLSSSPGALSIRTSTQNNPKSTQVGNKISKFFTPNPFDALSGDAQLTQFLSNRSPEKSSQQTTASANKLIAYHRKNSDSQAVEKNLSAVSAKNKLLSTRMLPFGLCRLVLSGGVLVSNLTLAAAKNYSLEFHNPHTGFNTEYTLVSSNLKRLTEIMSRIIDKCGGLIHDFKISPTINYVIYNVWGLIASRSSEGDREESFDDCIKEQVKSVAMQNNIILFTKFSVGGAIVAISWYYYKSSRFFSEFRNTSIISSHPDFAKNSHKK